MAATKQVAREAWRIFVNNTRSDLYEYMDSLHTSAMARWRSYDGNRDRCDAGPFELNEIDWYRRNRNWDGWLKGVHTWATQALTELYRMVARLAMVCSWAVLVFRGQKESSMDETLYLALEETKDVLGCFARGWQVTCRNMTLAEWCSFGAGPLATTRWNISFAAREDALMRQQAVSNVAPL